jgi:23S rRNA A2030 N6-methylase RlmJ
MSRLNEETRYRGISRFFYEDGKIKDRIPEWMTDTHLFVLGVLRTYAIGTPSVFEEMLEKEKQYGELDLQETDIQTVSSSLDELERRSVVKCEHGGYSLSELGNSYATEYADSPYLFSAGGGCRRISKVVSR